MAQVILDMFPDAVSEYGLLGCAAFVGYWLALAGILIAAAWLAMAATLGQARRDAEALAASMAAAAHRADMQRRANARTVWRRMARP